jgi:hypothetical protein
MARIDIGAIIIGAFALVVAVVALIFTLTAKSETEDVANDVKAKVMQLTKGLNSLHQSVSQAKAAVPRVYPHAQPHHRQQIQQQQTQLPPMPPQGPQGTHHMQQLKQILHRQDVMRSTHEMGPMGREQAPSYSVENTYPALPPAMAAVVDENITSGPVGRFFDDEYSKY